MSNDLLALKYKSEDVTIAPEDFNQNDIEPSPLKNGPWNINSLALDISGGCNLACKYCAEIATQPKRTPMKEAEFEAAWDLLFPDGIIRKETSIRFGSGEPFLAMPMLRIIGAKVEKARMESQSNWPDVIITTNATLLSEEICEWLIKNKWTIKISLDGPGRIHDYWRPDKKAAGTYDKISGHVTRLAKGLGDKFSVTAVMCPGSDPKEVFYSIAALGVRRIEMVPVATQEEKEIQLASEDMEKYKQFIFYYAQTLIDSDDIDKVPVHVNFHGQVPRVMGYTNQRIVCGAGRNFYGISPKGNIYPCYRFIGIDEYQLGNVKNGIDSDAVNSFREGPGRPYELHSDCKNCWGAALCGGPCFAEAQLMGKGTPLKTHCDYTLATAKAAVWFVSQLKKKDSAKLLRFIPISGEALGGMIDALDNAQNK